MQRIASGAADKRMTRQRASDYRAKHPLRGLRNGHAIADQQTNQHARSDSDGDSLGYVHRNRHSHACADTLSDKYRHDSGHYADNYEDNHRANYAGARAQLLFAKELEPIRTSLKPQTNFVGNCSALADF